MTVALNWKLVIDTRDAQPLADFWAAALGYEVEDPSELIARLLSTGDLPEAAVTEHNGHRVFRGYAAVRHPDDPYDPFTGIGKGRRLLFQDVPEGSRSEDVTSVPTAARPQLGALLAQLGALGPSRTGAPGRGLAA
ncbi:glyoxalase/bleomycin resistance/dioxygenase family protein [Streptomyces ipomoeae]|uniref:VOC family protein n=1 Tax=Streptomyces ipomoeae TaxID=103232 RepID=UPI0029B440E9|nr:VOC family protein [Streptomyces ipomoeae]MDX2822184.1 glyoxalase/bleomycin resistance/dioxygenase family protein [Streptomyces ipomoeae]MDX2873779.1 glyoxalase/bleomycin resistance/dioxygenase family protein [Streptomyces ipomoeae]